ncbi:AEC family transporter [Verrucomicrobia bacterium]|nr:AEC family transporter [Verrucomicrobiota bacterium]
MDEFQTILKAFLPVLTVGALGFISRRKSWLKPEADKSILAVLLNVLVPCLIFDAVLGNKALQEPSNIFLAPIVGFVTVVFGILVARLVAPLAGIKDKKEKGTFAFSAGIYNWGYVPIPLTLLLFGDETLGVLIVHNVGVEIAFWTIGLMALTGTKLKDGWKRVINPPAIAIVITLILNTAGADAWMPDFVKGTATMLGQCAIPLGIILIGATFADEIGEFHADLRPRVMTAACILRLGAVPFVFLLIAKYLPCSDELKRVIVVQSAMPAATFPIIIAKHYGGHINTTLRVIISTTLVSFITIPLWLPFGLKFVGLSD